MNDEVLGRLYIVAAPSGGGKTTLVNALIEHFDRLKISISYTTRPARLNEVNNENYHFVNEDTFQTMIANKDFLEHAQVYGYHYGTSHHWVLRQLQKGVDVILEIDWQGARQIRQLFSSAVSIFIIPPSPEILLERLKRRQQDSDEVIAERMMAAVSEMGHCHEFDYLVVNHQLEMALEDLAHIIWAERLRYERQRIAQADLLAVLLESE